MIKIQAIELYYGKSNFSMTLLICLVAKMHFSKMRQKHKQCFLYLTLIFTLFSSTHLLYIIAH
ncbi:TPA: hypothetical protein I2T90_06835 [Staphylococcus aureus]|nr:hypothetical protein CU118_10710 [Staphylococcus aureus]MSN55449.1 hypothetical protein [Staphylococcus aureus]MSN61811.1 hypothetical protein [Staphylococcus aureus]MSN63617.1 hypothetical protein [Staphylococcus aureus]MSN69694.1 hypothetical protein [Staphylococcus aureus]